VAVSPTRPGHTVIVEYRVNGGPVRQTIAVPEPPIPNVHGRLFRAILPAQSGGLVEYLPVLRFAGQPISPQLGELAEASRYQVGGATPVEAPAPPAKPSTELSAQPRWDWAGKYLGSCTIFLRKEVVGTMSDGLRVDWHFKEAHFVGPHLEGEFLPGAADWMRIRPDGVALVQVIGCLQTTRGARLFCSYGGIVDLGTDGYARALRGEFDPLPAFIGAPTYQTADKELEWLNRAQCLCVGRVDMKALRVEYDVYVIEVGGRKASGA
jgi:predicted small integral membrane protein